MSKLAVAPATVETTESVADRRSRIIAEEKARTAKLAAEREARKSATKSGKGEITESRGGVEYTLVKQGVNGYSLNAQIHFGIPEAMEPAKSEKLGDPVRYYLAKGIQGIVFTCPDDPTFGPLAGREVRFSMTNGTGYILATGK